MTSEMACRSCARTGVPLTVIYKNDGTGQQVPVSAVCRGGCPRTRTRTHATMTTAFRPGICASCRSEIIPPERDHQDWHDATGMDNAQVAVAGYCPDWWPASTRLLIRRVALDPGAGLGRPAVPAPPHPAPGPARPAVPELARAGAIYAYSFILTNLDVSAPDKAAAVEHWYRHRTAVETSKPQCCHSRGSSALSSVPSRSVFMLAA
jgi:hypothetical protein